RYPPALLSFTAEAPRPSPHPPLSITRRPPNHASSAALSLAGSNIVWYNTSQSKALPDGERVYAMSQPVTSARILPAATTLGPATLTIADLERSVAFYRDVLGFSVLRRDEEAVTFGAGESAAPILELTALAGARPKPRRSTGLYHVAILTPSRDSLA